MSTDDYFGGVNCIQSVILEGELTVVVRDKFFFTLGYLFSKAYCCFVEE